MNCEQCKETFPDNMDGLVIKTFHSILLHLKEEEVKT